MEHSPEAQGILQVTWLPYGVAKGVRAKNAGIGGKGTLSCDGSEVRAVGSVPSPLSMADVGLVVVAIALSFATAAAAMKTNGLLFIGIPIWFVVYAVIRAFMRTEKVLSGPLDAVSDLVIDAKRRSIAVAMSPAGTRKNIQCCARILDEASSDPMASEFVNQIERLRPDVIREGRVLAQDFVRNCLVQGLLALLIFAAIFAGLWLLSLVISP